MPIRHRPNLSTWWNTRIIRFGDAFWEWKLWGECTGGVVGWWYEQNGQNKESFSFFSWLTDGPEQGCCLVLGLGLFYPADWRKEPQRRKNEKVLYGGLRMRGLICGSDKRRDIERLTDELVLAIFWCVFMRLWIKYLYTYSMFFSYVVVTCMVTAKYCICLCILYLVANT